MPCQSSSGLESPKGIRLQPCAHSVHTNLHCKTEVWRLSPVLQPGPLWAVETIKATLVNGDASIFICTVNPNSITFCVCLLGT